MNVIDKRASREYQPSCTFCNDEGCPVCESTRAQRVAARLAEEAKRGLVDEARQFVRGRGWKMERPDQPVAMTAHDFVDWIMAAMEYGVALERENRVVATPPVEKCQRFDRLEIE